MRWVIMLVLGLYCHPSLWAQTRLNTDKLENKLKAEIAKQERELRAHEQRAKVLRAKANQSNKEAEKARTELKRIDEEIARYRQKKIAAFESIIEDLMNDADMGHLLRKEPNGIFHIPWIEEVILKEPWLLDEVLNILKRYR